MKTTAVEYEVYNPYTKTKIDLSICSNVSIAIYAPVNLTLRETNLYNDLEAQGYDLFETNNSFYIDPCTQYTSENGTDVSLADRKYYYYNEDIALCEDNCQYIKVNTTSEKVFCLCRVKDSVNVDNDQEFSPQKLLENFYKVDTYSNFEVLFCYKLLFSSKGLKQNICFYIILFLFVLFIISMIINLFSALKKINDLIFKIFQDRFMFYCMQKIIINGRKRRGAKINNNLIKDINKIEKGTPKLGWLQKLKLAKQKNENKNEHIPVEGDNLLLYNNNKTNLYNLNIKNKENNIKIKSLSKKGRKKKVKNFSLKPKYKDIKLENNDKNLNDIINNETHIENENNNQKDLIKPFQNNENNINIYNGTNPQRKQNIKNININIINNVLKKENPPRKKSEPNLNQTKDESKNISKEIIKKSHKRKRSKNNKKMSIINEKSNSIASNSNNNLNKIEFNKNKIQKTLTLLNGKNKKDNKENNDENKKEEHKKEPPKNPSNNIQYIDEELNSMDYENAIINDKRNYFQYYWSLLKKKHLIILTFVSNDDYNVFLLKFSLFVLSLALFFFINTLFFKDETLHTIFSQKGKYNILYQIPQVLYSTLISLIISLVLKKLSLSQNELISIKKELDMSKAKKLADKKKKCLKIKMYSFFSFGLILFIFFWYYLSAFSAVYKNTQLHLLKDTLLSFGISMLYLLLLIFCQEFFDFLL